MNTDRLILAAFVFIIGLVFGSFMAVLVQRVPEGRSIMTASACPLCKAPIRWYSNIPVLSYLLQRGRCRSCGGRISLWYPVIELCTAILFCLIFLQTADTIYVVKYCVFVFILLCAAFTDIWTALDGRFESGLIPDVYTIGGVLCGYAWALYTELAGFAAEPSFMQALAGSGAGYFMIMIPSFIYASVRKTEGIGEGDALLLAMVGSFMGTKALLLILLTSALIGMMIGIIVIAKTKNTRYKIPFAPAIALASVIWLIIGDI